MNCYVCGKKARWQCDHLANPSDKGTACLRPLCDDHRTNSASGFVCRRGERGGSGRFSIDYCPDHAPLHADKAG